jgi:hypothetical protein
MKATPSQPTIDHPYKDRIAAVVMSDGTAFREGGHEEAPRYVSIHNPLLLLPAEIRNEIYRLVLDMNREHAPLLHGRGEQKNRKFDLLQADRIINLEASSLMAYETPIYLLIDRTVNRYLPNSTSKKANTISRALKDFMNVHFHLYFDPLLTAPPPKPGYKCPTEYDMRAKLDEALFDVLKVYMASSQAVSKRHEWKRRRATIHLDHLLSGWPSAALYVPYAVGALEDLIELISGDVNTSWEIRFYVCTTAPVHVRAGYWEKNMAMELRETDLALLEAYCSKYDFITVKAEVYGPNKWEMENKSDNVIRVEKAREMPLANSENAELAPTL